MKKILISIVSILLFFFFTQPVFADDPLCLPLFGGGQTCQQTNQLTISKEVRNPQTGSYVASLGPNDPLYHPGDSVTFRLTVSNTGKQQLSHITVTDTFPQFVSFVSGSGSFDTKTSTLTFSIDSLAPGTDDVFYIEGKTADANVFPSQPFTCVANQATASTGNTTAKGNTSFCITPAPSATNQFANISTTKGGFPVYSPTQTRRTPSTGPELWEVFGLLPTGALGYWLRKRTK